MKLLASLCFPLLLTGHTCLANSDTTSPKTVIIPVDKNWTFEQTPVWSDEFDYTGLPDSTKWGYDIGGRGWGNHELQYYTDHGNAIVENGMLRIIAKKETKENRDYTSARLVSKGKGDFLYGRFEIRAQLPAGRGTWPAIWMLPTDWTYGGWPNSGEIDIMEHVGYDPGNVHVSTHTKAYYFKINTQKTSITKVDSIYTAFHTYRLDWTPTTLRAYIDDKQVFEMPNEGAGFTVWPFDKRFHILLNVAVGGDWGGQQGIDDTIFPTTMLVDYVRVYRMIEKP